MSLPRAGLYRLLPTEQPNPRTRDIDLKSTLQVVRTINGEDRRVAVAVGREAARIARGVDLLAKTLKGGGRIVFVGAGTSGRLGVLEAAECPPTFGTPPSLIRGVMAGGCISVFSSKEGAEDDPKDGARQVRTRARRGDAIVGIAASGVTPFVRGALQEGRRLGCGTILVTSNRRHTIPEAQVVISPNTGPEVISGSTRLKSGTAAKLVLNMLTTATMIRVGKVYDHWMVDLKPTSRKLRLRGVRIVCDLGKVEPKVAEALFKASGGSVKVSVLAARLKSGTLRERVVEAGRRLEDAGGILRTALEKLRA
ncbi:MAG: N-acetylmuramic acid 6-phosphate etherase [Elusimicrobia bacterium]|nr:N-acetylmuramic acid 6-phosphate etherase [Elusimicrobiota bacterium]